MPKKYFSHMSSKLKKLTEEIEADIVHHKDKNIIFFVQDKLNYENHLIAFLMGKM